MSDATTTPTPTTPQSAAPISTLSESDLERLVEKVYRLMLADLRQGIARRGGQR